MTKPGKYSTTKLGGGGGFGGFGGSAPMSSGFLPSMRDKPDSPPVKTTWTPWAVKIEYELYEFRCLLLQLTVTQKILPDVA